MIQFISKAGAGSFGRKVERLIRRGQRARARWLVRERIRRHGESQWTRLLVPYGVADHA